jgi:hypothetical protein
MNFTEALDAIARRTNFRSEAEQVEVLEAIGAECARIESAVDVMVELAGGRTATDPQPADG